MTSVMYLTVCAGSVIRSDRARSFSASVFSADV
jgi:hypothetical protein